MKYLSGLPSFFPFRRITFRKTSIVIISLTICASALYFIAFTQRSGSLKVSLPLETIYDKVRRFAVQDSKSTRKDQLTNTLNTVPYKCSKCSCGHTSNENLDISTKAEGLKTCLNIKLFNLTSTKGVGRTNFSLIMPHIEPSMSCEERELFIAVVVSSGASDDKHRLLRMTIRQTWGKFIKTQNQLKWRLFFALGMTGSRMKDRTNQQEAQEYNDIIIGDFPDVYKNIVLKTFMSHFWAYFRLSCKYVLKTDDDVYVRVPRLARWLEKEGFPQPFYGGFLNENPIVFRDPRSKWYISKEEFSEPKWPPFSHGAFQVISTAILPKYFNYTQFRKPFTTDDAYFGVVARDLGITARNIPGFSLTPPKTEHEHVMATAFGHALNSLDMVKFHSKYDELII